MYTTGRTGLQLQQLDCICIRGCGRYMVASVWSPTMLQQLTRKSSQMHLRLLPLLLPLLPLLLLPLLLLHAAAPAAAAAAAAPSAAASAAAAAPYPVPAVRVVYAAAAPLLLLLLLCCPLLPCCCYCCCNHIRHARHVPISTAPLNSKAYVQGPRCWVWKNKILDQLAQQNTHDWSLQSTCSSIVSMDAKNDDDDS